jgi:hypothetical protein
MLGWLAGSAWLLAEVAPPQQFLPPDTLAVVTLPDVPAARSAWQASNPGRLWADPAMGDFRARFEGAFRQKWLAGVERESGLDLGELLALTRGQATFAVLPPPTPTPGAAAPGIPWLLLLDAREGSDALARLLDKARAHLATKAPSVATNLQIDGHRFTRLTLDLQASVPPGAQVPAEKLEDEDLHWEVCFGQVGSAFVAGPSWSAVSNVIPRLAATNAAAGMAGRASFARLWSSTLKDRPAWFHVDVAAVYQRIAPGLEGVFGMLSLLGADPAKVVPATGLVSIGAVAGAVTATEAGMTADLVVECPAAKRAGLTQVMQILPKEAGLPEGIPDGVASFQRWRIDGAGGWKALESSLERVSPNLGKLARITVESAGQVFDPNFNLQRDLVGNLGDDFITFSLPPTGTNLLQLSRSGRVQMVGSPNPARLTSGWKALEALVHMQAGALEFSERTGPGGRKVMVATVAAKGGAQNAFQMVQAPTHVVIASDGPSMDAYLAAASGRRAPTPPGNTTVPAVPAAPAPQAPVAPAPGTNATAAVAQTSTPGAPGGFAAIPGWSEAVAGVGGTGRGLFGFAQPALELRPVWEALRTSESLAGVMPAGTTSLETVQAVESWADFKRLPPFEAVARYWTLQALSGATDAEGYRFRWFSPRAP